ncbi:MAG TPA: amidase [Terriglobales bacterium]|nr:amidase [Terriglobales bacterium]
MSNRREFLKTGVLGAAAVAAASKLELSASAQTSAKPFELEEITVAELRAGLDSGRFTSQQLVEMYSQRIAEIDKQGPSVNAVIEMNPDAMEIAAKADQERKAGGARGPMQGIPLLIKDNIATADKMSTSAGSLALKDAKSPKDSFVAAQLRKAGAVILGKTNLSEWANIRSSHSSSGWSGRGGQTKCPFALDRNPSGSSSGSGAAASANECAVAIGTETDGSIVSPSCSNGLVGIKPTVGLIGRTGIIPISHTQDTPGPMARTVADAAALLTVLAAVDPEDEAAKASAGKAQDYLRALNPNALKGARLGVLRKYADVGINEAKLFDDALKVLKDSGAEIVDPLEIKSMGSFDDKEFQVLLYELKADLPKYFEWFGPTSPLKTLADAIKFNEDHAAEEMPYFGQEVFLKAQDKGPLTSAEYVKALAACRKGSREEGIDAAMNQHKLDAIICPTGSCAWPIDLVNGDGGYGSASSLAAVAGYPHITLPMGYVFGMPVGISFFGRAWSEAKLIGLAYAYEQKTKCRKAPKFLPTAEVRV